MDLLEPNFRDLLIKFQTSLNEALRQNANTFAKVKCRNFHFDYIEDAGIPNALAFEYEGYAFVGITMSLIKQLWKTSDDLSLSTDVAAMLGNTVTSEQREMTIIEFFETQILFVVLHEFAHHDLGHLSRHLVCDFWNEILPQPSECNIERQARETTADGWATTLGLNHLMTTEQRNSYLVNLGHPRIADDSADEILLSFFIMAMAAFFLIMEPQICDEAKVYKFSHPPYAARMNDAMRNVQTWCKQNRPRLEQWLTLKHFQELLFVVEKALHKSGWKQQTAFLRSEDGGRYIKELQERAIAQISQL